MLQLPTLYTPPMFGDETVLRSIDWLENLPWWQENTVKYEKDRYEISLQVKHFTPNEISVKTIDGYIVVEAQHEEKQDEYGYISRKFVRRYKLPDECKPGSVKSRLTPDEVLIITAIRQPVVKHDTMIPVKHEGALNKSKL